MYRLQKNEGSPWVRRQRPSLLQRGEWKGRERERGEEMARGGEREGGCSPVTALGIRVLFPGTRLQRRSTCTPPSGGRAHKSSRIPVAHQSKEQKGSRLRGSCRAREQRGSRLRGSCRAWESGAVHCTKGCRMEVFRRGLSGHTIEYRETRGGTWASTPESTCASTLRCLPKSTTMEVSRATPT